MVNKRGWIRIIEAVVAVLIIVGVVLTMIGGSYVSKIKDSGKIYEIEKVILKEIQLNNSLRTAIVGITFGEDVPQIVVDKINQRKPDYLNCTSKICEISDACILDSYEDKEVYAKSVMISSDTETYSPRQLKIFCWKIN